RGWELDLEQLAFRPPEDKKAPAEASDPQKSEGSWWQAFWQPVPPRLIDRDEALMHLLHAGLLADSQVAPLRHIIRWQNSQAAGLIAAGNTWASPVALCDAHFRLALFGPRSSEADQQAIQGSPGDRLVTAFI